MTHTHLRTCSILLEKVNFFRACNLVHVTGALLIDLIVTEDESASSSVTSFGKTSSSTGIRVVVVVVVVCGLQELRVEHEGAWLVPGHRHVRDLDGGARRRGFHVEEAQASGAERRRIIAIYITGSIHKFA